MTQLEAVTRATRSRAWRPVTTGGRMPFVECVICRARQLNETNRLHRGGWLESAGGPRVFVCGDCAQPKEETR